MRTALMAALRAGLLLALLAGVLPTGLLANGATQEVLRTVSGPYEIMVGALPNPPREGFIHLTVTVTNIATAQPVTDAQVRVLVQRKGEQERVQALLLNSPASPIYYDRNIEVPRAGLWLFTIEVTGTQGEATAQFPLEVEDQPQGLAGRLAWSVMTGVVLLGALYVWWSIRRSRRRRRAQS